MNFWLVSHKFQHDTLILKIEELQKIFLLNFYAQEKSYRNSI